jgi:hypothetical protein
MHKNVIQFQIFGTINEFYQGNISHEPSQVNENAL